MAPAPTCDHLKCQKAAVKAERQHTQLVLSAVAVACGSFEDKARPSVQIAEVLLGNMVKIGALVKERKISSTELRQLKQFAEKHCQKPDVSTTDEVVKTPPVLSTEARRALAKKLANMNTANVIVAHGPPPSTQLLKDLLEAYQAHIRIETLLQNYTGPELTCVRSLFPLLKNLPLGTNSSVLADPPIPVEMVSQNAIRHSIIQGSKGTLLFRGDLCRLILANSPYYRQLIMQKELTTAEKALLMQIFQSYQTERNAILSKMVFNVQAEAEIYRRMGLKMDNEYTFEPNSLPIMHVLEAYHAVSLLNQFFNGNHPGPEFAGIRRLLYKCRQELQMGFTKILKRTDFLTYIS